MSKGHLLFRQAFLLTQSDINLDYSDLVILKVRSMVLFIKCWLKEWIWRRNILNCIDYLLTTLDFGQQFLLYDVQRWQLLLMKQKLLAISFAFKQLMIKKSEQWSVIRQRSDIVLCGRILILNQYWIMALNKYGNSF